VDGAETDTDAFIVAMLLFFRAGVEVVGVDGETAAGMLGRRVASNALVAADHPEYFLWEALGNLLT
jgi:hypothetical protein